MALIPKNDSLDHQLNNILQTEELRPYSGLSSIGDSCHRHLQYIHYWCYAPTHSRRMKRLFGIGHSAEDMMTADLATLGITVTDQQQSIIATGGHWRGHIDGKGNWGDAPEFLVEFKTHNDKSFKDLKKHKVKVSKPSHYGQMQAYMGYLELPKCLYMAYNKNDSEYYIEWVHADEECFRENRRKEAEVIMSDVLLPKVGTGTSTWFTCKMCDARHVCHNGKLPVKSCRTCEYVDVLDNGEWKCTTSPEAYGNLSVQEQRDACGDYKLGAMFK